MLAGSVTLSANASDEVGGSGIVGVQFKLDGKDIAAEDTTPPYSLNWNSAFASNGAHVLSAVARDAAGNISTASVTITAQNVSSIANGTYKLTARHSGKALYAASTNGSQVEQKTATGSPNFKWNVQNLGGNQYSLTCAASGRNLNVAYASTANGANVIVWTPTPGSDNEKWTIQATGDGYYTLTAVHSGKLMEVTGASTANGADVIQWSATGAPNQQWSLQLQ